MPDVQKRATQDGTSADSHTLQIDVSFQHALELVILLRKKRSPIKQLLFLEILK